MSFVSSPLLAPLPEKINKKKKKLVGLAEDKEGRARRGAGQWGGSKVAAAGSLQEEELGGRGGKS